MTPFPPDESDRTVAREDRDATGFHAPTGGADLDTPNDPIPVIDPERTMARAAGPRAATSAGLYVPGFVVTGEIARGGMGVVLAAIEVALNREVAIKMLLPGAVGAERAARRFVEEACITARLSHPGIPPIHQVGELADGRPYLAMKLIRGRTLATILSAREQRPSSLSVDELDLTALESPGLLHVFEQICHAVGYAHSQGFVHRDLKPANVMVGNFGEVQVMDWGIAKQVGTSDEPCASAARSGASETQCGQAMGTPQYMPPEQARGEWARVGARADVFALGGILAAVLTGNPPYTGTTPYAVLKRAEAADLGECFARLDASGTDPELIALAKRCLASDPDARPANGAEIARQIAAFRLGVEARLVAAEAERATAAAHIELARRRATAEALSRRAADARAEDAEMRAAEAEQYAASVLATAKRRSRDRWVVFAALVGLLVVLSGVYANYREHQGRRATIPPCQGACEYEPPKHAAEHEAVVP